MPAPVKAPETSRANTTLVHFIPVLKDLKDSRLLFVLQVPAEWNVTTLRLTRSDTAGYRTDLVPGSVFAIYSSPLTGSREQEYRDRFRQWVPPPAETAVTINGIRYDRFESDDGTNTTVAYLPRPNDVNERGYGGVLVFAARDSDPFRKEDFENVVSSFRYFGTRTAATVPGEEIPLYDLSGPVLPDAAGAVHPVSPMESGWGDTGTVSGGESHASASAPPSSGCHH